MTYLKIISEIDPGTSLTLFHNWLIFNMKTFRPFKIKKKYKPFKFKIKKRPVYKPLRVKKPKPYKRGRLLKSGIIQHMRVTCTGRRYWTPIVTKIIVQTNNFS